MFKTFFLSELKYALKQPMIYIFMGVIGLLVFGATASDNVIIGGAVGKQPHFSTMLLCAISAMDLTKYYLLPR